MTEQWQDLSKRQRQWLNIAVKAAATSLCRTKHGAVIVRGGRVLSIGTNRFMNHPDYVDDFNDCNVHAEIHAIKQVKNCKGATIYVARVNNSGTPRLSRPCKRCFRQILNAGISRIVFTIDNPGFVL